MRMAQNRFTYSNAWFLVGGTVLGRIQKRGLVGGGVVWHWGWALMFQSPSFSTSCFWIKCKLSPTSSIPCLLALVPCFPPWWKQTNPLNLQASPQLSVFVVFIYLFYKLRFSWGLFAAIEQTQSSSRRKELIWFTSPGHRRQGRNSSSPRTWWQEVNQKPWGNIAYCILACSLWCAQLTFLYNSSAQGYHSPQWAWPSQIHY